MNMKKFSILIVLVFAVQAAFSQGNPYSTVFTQYHVSPILISPAAAGFSESHQLLMNVRAAWTGFPESPNTYAIGYNGPIGKTLGLGLQLLSETAGNVNSQRVQLNYAFRYELNKLKFAMGFSTEFLRMQLANSVTQSSLYQPGDLIVEAAIEGNRTFDASLGFHGTYDNKTYFGLTFSNLVLSKIGDIESGDPEGTFFRYFMLNFGHEFDIEQYNFKIRPSVMVQRIKDRPFQIDFNLLGSFIGDKLIAGASYRAGLGGAVGLLLGTNVDVFRLYYGYDVSFQRYQRYNSGTHEVTIAFEFDGGKKKFDRSQGKR